MKLLKSQIVAALFLAFGSLAGAAEPLLRDIPTEYTTPTGSVACKCSIVPDNIFALGVKLPWLLTRVSTQNGLVEETALSAHISQYSCDFTRVAQCQGEF